jgi:hypothetical protein
MERLKTPFFLVSVAAMILVILIETGSSFLLGGHNVGADLAGQANSLGVAVPAGAQTPPGLGIRYLALVDAAVLFTVGLMAVGLLVPQRIQGRVQAVATLIFAILLILGALVLLFVAILKVILMVALFFAFPFGTIAYLIIWGSFPRGHTTVLLSLIMFLKLVYCVFLLIAQPRFLMNKGLVLLSLTSLICNIVVSFLQGLVPGVLVSITDGVAAIVCAIVAIIWGIVLLIGSIPGIVRALQTSAEAVGKRPMQLLNPIPYAARLLRRARSAA